MDYDTSGINESGIDKLILDIYDYSDKIKTILNSLEDLIDSTKSCYDSPDGNEFRAKFSLEKDSINNLISNILSYTEDLTLVKKDFKNISLNATEQVFQERINLTQIADEYMRR